MKENRELEKIENIMEIEIPIDTKSKENNRENPKSSRYDIY